LKGGCPPDPPVQETFDVCTMFESLKLADLPQRHIALLREPTRTRPAVWLIEERGVQAVVKDFSANHFLYRTIVGRFLVWREGKALRRLRGIKGIPNLFKVVDGIALVMEEIPGKNLEELGREGKRLPPRFFDDLAALVDRFHRRGIAHCDLKRAPNTLVGPDGAPYIIDWGASICETEFRLFPLPLVFRRFQLDDRLAVTKFKLRHCPEAVSHAELTRYQHRSRMETLIRRVRDRLREWLQKIA